jgi:hypothetical protein
MPQIYGTRLPSQAVAYLRATDLKVLGSFS